MPLRRARTIVAVFALAAALAGCPPTMEATRDGGTTCVTTAGCNPTGMTCGDLRLCVQGFCTDTTTVVACREGGYPDGGPSGNCATYEDCNGTPACGSVIPCINFVCDPTAPRLDIPCADGGDASRPDATGDGFPGFDASGTEAGASDVPFSG